MGAGDGTPAAPPPPPPPPLGSALQGQGSRAGSAVPRAAQVPARTMAAGAAMPFHSALVPPETRKFTRALSKPGTAAELRQSVSEVVRSSVLVVSD